VSKIRIKRKIIMKMVFLFIDLFHHKGTKSTRGFENLTSDE